MRNLTACGGPDMRLRRKAQLELLGRKVKINFYHTHPHLFDGTWTRGRIYPSRYQAFNARTRQYCGKERLGGLPARATRLGVSCRVHTGALRLGSTCKRIKRFVNAVWWRRLGRERKSRHDIQHARVLSRRDRMVRR